MKKITLGVLTILVMVSLVFVSCTKKDVAEESGDMMITVGMATDVGGLGDGSFNDGSHDGIIKAEKEGLVKSTFVESKQMTDYVPNLAGLAEDGSALVFAVGFLMQDACLEVANNYPDTKFAAIDVWYDPATSPDNILGITYKEQEAGYLAGIVAGYMTKEYADKSDKLNDKNVVGVILGMDIPPCEKYEVGFIAGVKSVNPDCEVLTAVAGDFGDLAKGKEMSLSMINQGADIVFQVAGGTGIGVINGAKEAGVLAIGVDVDQNGVAPETVLTSAMKGITQSSYLVSKSVAEGTFEGGNVTLGIAEGAIDLAPYHGFEDIVPQEVKDAVMKAKEDLASGALTIPASRADL